MTDDWALERPIPDWGPYGSEGQALRQFDAVTHNLPGPSGYRDTVLIEALTKSGAGADLTGFEAQIRAQLTERLDDAGVQVVAGWLLRAYLSGAGIDPPTS